MAHKKIDFTKPGGFPLSQDVLKFLQEGSLDELNALARIVGNNVILSGCSVSNQNILDGWMIINNEIIPFKKATFVGSISSVKIKVTTDKTKLIFEDGEQKEVQISKYASVSTTLGTPFNSFKRLGTILSLDNKVWSMSSSITTTLEPFQFLGNAEIRTFRKELTDNFNVKKGYYIEMLQVAHDKIEISGTLLFRDPYFTVVDGEPSISLTVKETEFLYNPYYLGAKRVSSMTISVFNMLKSPSGGDGALPDGNASSYHVRNFPVYVTPFMENDDDLILRVSLPTWAVYSYSNQQDILGKKGNIAIVPIRFWLKIG